MVVRRSRARESYLQHVYEREKEEKQGARKRKRNRARRNCEMEEDGANELLKRRRGRNGCACADTLFTSPVRSVDAAAAAPLASVEMVEDTRSASSRPIYIHRADGRK